MVDCGLSLQFFKIHFVGPEDLRDASTFKEKFGEPLICVSILVHRALEPSKCPTKLSLNKIFNQKRSEYKNSNMILEQIKLKIPLHHKIFVFLQLPSFDSWAKIQSTHDQWILPKFRTRGHLQNRNILKKSPVLNSAKANHD